jgi:HPt (histidine-containing phosphotransfer) domain-containing protein
MLNDTPLYNSWAAYEPNSFDGNDAPHGDEYAGAPSGRYVRSYVRAARGGEDAVVIIPDMPEEELNDPGKTIWYTTPLETGVAFNDFGATSVHDYRTGEGKIANITVSSPILRYGKPVGVVGADIRVRDLVLENELGGQTVTAVFSREGKLVFSRGVDQVGMAIEDMNFTRLDQIREAMREGREIFLEDEFSWFLDMDTFTYLKPVSLENFGGQVVYLYAAQPSAIVDQAVLSALRPIFIALSVMLLVFVTLFLFIVYQVINPLNQLMYSIDMIGGSGVVQRFPHLGRLDEIGDLARSISRLWQHFRMRLNYLYIIKIKLESYIAIQRAIHKSLSFEEASKHILRRLQISFKADIARFFIYYDRQARLFAISGTAGEFYIRSAALGPEFEGHEILAKALKDKHYLLMKSYAMRLLGLEFISPKAWSVCVLPIRVGKQLRAFIVLESSDPQQVILQDDSVLGFISSRLADFFDRFAPLADEAGSSQTTESVADESADHAIGLADSPSDGDHTAPVPAALSPETAPLADNAQDNSRTQAQRFVDAARRISGLGVDKALSMLGGNLSLYMEMLSLSARELPVSMEKMRGFLAAGDVSAFAIEVHGSKGALNTIGALYLGEQAYRLEMSGKAGDLEGCRLSYPHFEQTLSDFVGLLHTMLPKQEDSPHERRPVEDLLVDLKTARAALKDYNLALANERLRHVMQFSYVAPGLDEATIAQKLETVSACLESIEYEEADRVIQEMLASVGEDKAGAGEAKWAG